MNDLSWIAPTVAAICSALVAIVAASRSKDNGKKVEEVAAKVEQIEALKKSSVLAASVAEQAATDVRVAKSMSPPDEDCLEKIKGE